MRFSSGGYRGYPPFGGGKLYLSLEGCEGAQLAQGTGLNSRSASGKPMEDWGSWTSTVQTNGVKVDSSGQSGADGKSMALRES